MEQVERNLRRYQQCADLHGCALRPHTKTHKMVRLAKTFCPDVEFSAEDASRSDPAFLAQVCAAVPLPVYAIGGVGPEHIPALAAAGAAGGCVRSPLMTCPDPGAYLRQWKEAAAHV